MIMSRPFNYIAWHKPTKKMFKVYGISGDYIFEDTLDGLFTSPTNPAALEDCTLLQYSGMFDVKGAEIFEADVIENKFARFVVEFNKGCFCVRRIGSDPDQTTLLPLRGVIGAKRIGNSLQFPYLIEAIKDLPLKKYEWIPTPNSNSAHSYTEGSDL